MKITKEMTDELNLIFANLGCMFKFDFDKTMSSIEVVPANSMFIKSCIINLTDDCYKMIEAFFKTNNITLTYNNTKDIMWGINNTINYNLKYYNLFVLEDDDMENNTFIMPIDKALNECNGDIKRFAVLDDKSQQEIKNMPSLFVNNSKVFLGNVTYIKIQQNGVKIRFNVIKAIDKLKIQGILDDLKIKHRSYNSELNNLHWVIKDVNLLKMLAKNNIIDIV